MFSYLFSSIWDSYCVSKYNFKLIVIIGAPDIFFGLYVASLIISNIDAI